MSVIFDPSLPLGNPYPYLDGDEALAARVRMVLETRPGRIPWRPNFGCDLAGLVGFPATPDLLSKARSAIQNALKTWLRDATVLSVEVRATPVVGGHGSSSYGAVPLAETALLTLGVQAVLEADIEIKGPAGVVAFSAVVNP
jgi:phage baseplate assembly protein W